MTRGRRDPRVSHRPGFGWLVVVVAGCAIAALVVIGLMRKEAQGAQPASCAPRGAPLADFSPGELRLFAQTVYGEARGESFAGQLAVAHVVLNRLEAGSYGATVGKVIRRDRQFSVWLPGDLKNQRLSRVDEGDPAYLTALLAALQATLGVSPDPSLGATHFLRSGTQKPSWVRKLQPRIQIGAHTFYREMD